MKQRKIAIIVTILVIAFIGLPASHAQSVWVEAEAFSHPGGWCIDQQFMDQMGSPYLLAHGWGKRVADASTEVIIPKAGNYHVYVRTYNWTSPWSAKPGPGRFQVIIDGKRIGGLLGSEGNKWTWQMAGCARLKEGSVTIRLHDLTGFDGRCDAILISRDTDPRKMDDASLHQIRKQLTNIYGEAPETRQYDFCVIGGGVAGMCAAVAAARLGCRVALVQDRPVLGGPNSSEIQIAIGGKIEIGQNAGLGRMLREFAYTHPNHAQVVTPWEDARKDSFIHAEQNIDYLSGYHATRVEKAGNAIKSVIATNIRSGREIRISAPLFADCTGDATIGYLAGADYHMGREGRAEFGESLAPPVADSMVMGSTVKWQTEDTGHKSQFPLFEYGLSLDDKSCRPVTQGDWNWEYGMLQDQVADAERIRDYALLTIYSNWSWLKNRSRRRNDFSRRHLTWVGYVLGKRESRRLLGDYILSQQDIDKNLYHEDGTCCTTWSIDLHLPDSDNMRLLPHEPFMACAIHRPIYPYPIPYRCLYSRNVENLFMAGRDISATHVAFASTRVMCTTAMMGEVIGMAASICRRYGLLPRQVYQQRLPQLRTLMRRGAGHTKSLPQMTFEFYQSLDHPRTE